MLFAWLAMAGMSCTAVMETVAPEKTQAASDGGLSWYDCKNLCLEGKGWTDTETPYDRLPARANGKVAELDWRFNHCPAGFCVYFATDAPSVEVRWTLLQNEPFAMPHMPATGVSGVDLYAQSADGSWRFVNNGRPVGAANNARFDVTPHGECLLYLPLYNGVKSIEIGIPKGKSLMTPAKTERKHDKSIAFYGTSIDQGACASRPGMAFTAIVGRALNVEIINLGFSGSGKMEPAMADFLAELNPTVFVLDGLWNMSPTEVAGRAAPFVLRIRKARPDTPILLVEEANFRNTCPTEKGIVLRGVLKQLTDQGVKEVHLMPSQNVLGTDGEASVDGVHPNDLGMMRQAEALVRTLRPLLRDKQH
jgi:hypothetical protein